MAESAPPEPQGGPLHVFLEGIYQQLFRGIAALGLPPSFVVVLEVRRRHSGGTQSVVLITGQHERERYLVSVIGDEAQWVRNVRAAGEGVIRHGRRRTVRLEEVAVDQRAPILKAYLKWSLGARPLFDVSHKAPVEEFERIASKHPVFRIQEGQ